jgi:hypothetical protein
MKKQLLGFLLVVVLAAAAAGTWRFAAMVVHEYEHAHEVVLTNLGAGSGVRPKQLTGHGPSSRQSSF